MLRLAFLAHTDALGAGNAVRQKGQIHSNRQERGVAMQGTVEAVGQAKEFTVYIWQVSFRDRLYSAGDRTPVVVIILNVAG